MKYKGVQKALPEIARELNVDAILEGSALLRRRARAHQRPARRRARDETLWSDRYDRELEDVLDLQSEVAGTVAKEIALQVTPRRGQAARPSGSAVNPEAHVEYLKGQHIAAATSPQAIELSLRHFQRALELDPSFAPAWAGVADCHLMRAGRGMAPPAEAAEAARAAARRALELDESLADAHAVLGWLDARAIDLAGAIRSLERAIELNPGLTSAYMVLGRVYYCTERHAEAQETMLKALSLDPLSMIIHTTVGDAYYYAREYEKSVRTTGRRSSSTRGSTARTPTSRARSRRSGASTRRARSTRRAAGSAARWRGRRSASRTSRPAWGAPTSPGACSRS